MKLNDLLNFKDIIIQCHNNPDADTIASGFAVHHYLKNNGINSELIYSGFSEATKPNILTMIEQLDIPIRYVPSNEAKSYRKPELLLTVDCLHGESNVVNFDAVNYAAIDHHICYGQLPPLSEIRSNYGSCSSLIAKMYDDEGININENEAISTALYYGLFMDTNSFSELYHPADKDLRDIAKFDSNLINILKNSNLSAKEMKIAGTALNNCSYNSKYRYAIVEAQQCDPNILGFISDLVLQVNTVDACVVYCKTESGAKLSTRSCTYEINAGEFAKYIVEGVGGAGGHAMKAGGTITEKLLGIYTTRDYIANRVLSYFTEIDVIKATEFKPNLSDMETYKKKSVILGYVKSTDIIPSGTEIQIRMLEADLSITASDDIYIMIGIEGEVYPVEKSRFERSYTITNEPLDVDFEYKPTIIDRETNSIKKLLPYVKGCVSGESAQIYAKKLTRTTKVFTEWDKTSYMLGNPGDYLVVRYDNTSDAYIIKSKIFDKTYISC